VYFELVEGGCMKHFLEDVYSSKARNSKNKKFYINKGHPESYKVQEMTDTGFGYYFYSN